MKNQELENRFLELLGKGRQTQPLHNFAPEACQPNEAPLYRQSLPEYDFSSFGLEGLQSMFTNLAEKLKEAEERVILEVDYTERIRVLRERDILKKTLQAIEDAMIHKKKERLVQGLEYQAQAAEARRQVVLQEIAKENQEYQYERALREKELMLIGEAETNKLLDLVGSVRQNANLEKMRKMQAEAEAAKKAKSSSKPTKGGVLKKKADSLAKKTDVKAMADKGSAKKKVKLVEPKKKKK